MTSTTELDCIQFTKYAPNACWKKADTGNDPSSVLWVTLSSCVDTPTIMVVNNEEQIEMVFHKVGSTVRVKDNSICYHKANLVRIKKL
jgi:hypothetical protein